MTKRACDPSKALCNNKVQKWLKTSRDRAWFIAGHTRFATRGAINRRNSHPFRYGRIIGSHNGICDAPQKFTVDSEYLFWALNKARGDYNKALGDVSGYWGLSWYNGEDFYLMSHNGELAVVEVDGVWYYSSSWKHLDACTGGDSHTLGEGEVWKFNESGLVGSSNQADSDVKAFVSTSSSNWGFYNNSSRFGATTYNAVKRSYAPGHKVAEEWWRDNDETATSINTEVRDYDQEWADAWSSYCANSESAHIMSDEEFENSKYAG